MKLITLQLIEIQRHRQDREHDLPLDLRVLINLDLEVLQFVPRVIQEGSDLIIRPVINKVTMNLVAVQVANRPDPISLEDGQCPLDKVVHQGLIGPDAPDHILLVLGEWKQLDLDPRQVLGALDYVAETAHDHGLDLLEPRLELDLRIFEL